jgi:hypothetical protein
MLKKYYQSKYDPIRGSSDKEIFYEARKIFRKYDNKRRLPYVRSRYFEKQKVFLSMFWRHLNSKDPLERRRRIPFLLCAIDLIQNSPVGPVITNLDESKDVYYRFYGKTRSGNKFVVQVIKDKKSNRYFMSCFPVKK